MQKNTVNVLTLDRDADSIANVQTVQIVNESIEIFRIDDGFDID